MDAFGPTEFGYQRAFPRGGGSGCRPALEATQVRTSRLISSKQMLRFTSMLSFPVCSKNYTCSVL